MYGIKISKIFNIKKIEEFCLNINIDDDKDLINRIHINHRG